MKHVRRESILDRVFGLTGRGHEGRLQSLESAGGGESAQVSQNPANGTYTAGSYSPNIDSIYGNSGLYEQDQAHPNQLRILEAGVYLVSGFWSASATNFTTSFALGMGGFASQPPLALIQADATHVVRMTDVVGSGIFNVTKSQAGGSSIYIYFAIGQTVIGVNILVYTIARLSPHPINLP